MSDLEFCAHCMKIIPPSETAHIWQEAVVCGTCNQILRSVTVKASSSQDSMFIGKFVARRPARMLRHEARLLATRCPHCRGRLVQDDKSCPKCKRVLAHSSFDILPL